MQPDDQNGYWQPNGPQPPVAPTQPQPAPQVPPAIPLQSSQPLQPVYQAPPLQQIQPAQPAQQPYQPVQQPQQPIADQQTTPPNVDTTSQPQQSAVGNDIDQGTDTLTDDPSGYDPDDDAQEYEEVDLTEPVNWEASEYIHQEKNVVWFVIFGVIMAALIAVAAFLMRAWTFVALLVVITVAIVVFAKRPPRVMSYSLSEKGLHIGDTLHHFTDYKSFGIIRDGEEFSVMLIPIKRLQPGITVYFPEESGEAIVDMLGSRLPIKELHLDIVDKLVRKLRL